MSDRTYLEVRVVGRGPGRTRLQVSGELDFHTAPILRSGADPLCEHGDVVVLDLASVSFVDSRGIVALIQLRESCERAGGAVELENIQPGVRRNFSLIGIDPEIDQAK